VHRLDVTQARRIAVRAQLLDRPRPTDLAEVVRRLTFLQIDPTAAVAPSADLVAWTRLGSAYEPAHLQQALEQERSFFELDAMIRPMADLRLYLARMAAGPVEVTHREWLAANDSFRRDVLDRLGESGPLLSRDVPDTSVVPWASTGWTNNRNVTKLLELLVACGQIAVAGRVGRQRLWDLAERVYPADAVAVPEDEARRLRSERRLQSLGIARPSALVGWREPVEITDDVGEPAVVDGVPGTWRVDPQAVDGTFVGRTALLSPFDRLIHDRVRTQDLFDFEYLLEMYKPKAQRRWGYFALPVLHHDRLVGKVDATAERKRGTLVVNAIHEDVPFTPEITDAVRGELEALAAWQGLALSAG
jgi:hypothetical protein